jgi:hypothetical protein
MTTFRGFEAGTARDGSLQQLSLTQITTNETLLGAPVTLDIVSVPGVSYTYNPAHNPQWNGGASKPKQLALVNPMIAGKNTAATATTINIDFRKNGVSVFNTSQSVAAGQFWTWNFRRLWSPALVAGDVIEIRVWASAASAAYYDWYAFPVLPSRINPLSSGITKEGFVRNLVMSFLARPTFTTAGSVSGSTPWTLFNDLDGNFTLNINPPNDFTYPVYRLADPIYTGRVSLGDLGNQTTCVTHATLRPAYAQWSLPVTITWRRMG